MLVFQYEDMLNAMVLLYFGNNKAEDMEEYLAKGLPSSLAKMKKFACGGLSRCYIYISQSFLHRTIRPHKEWKHHWGPGHLLILELDPGAEG
jgi:hypothetical protein